MESQKELWVPTKVAEKLLCIKRDTLKRNYAHPEKGFLKKGRHWKRGIYKNSSIHWEINACRKELLRQGFVFANSA